MTTLVASAGQDRAMLDSTILIRVVAITLIVCGHFDVLYYGGGGAYTLMLLAGITYAKYILPKFSRPAVAHEAHVQLILKIALPAVLYTAFTPLLGRGEVDWRAVMLISNFFPPSAASYWFIEVYIQLNLLLLLVSFWAAGQRGLHRFQDFLPAMLFWGLLVSIAALSSLLWDTSHLFNRVPQQMAWLFAAGIALAASTTPRLRLAFLVLFVLACQLLWGLAQTPPFFLAAIVLLVVIPGLPSPRLLAWLAEKVATASLMIYLTHFQWGLLWKKMGGEMSSGTAVLIALLGGVVLQTVYNAVWLRCRLRLSRVWHKA